MFGWSRQQAADAPDAGEELVAVPFSVLDEGVEIFDALNAQNKALSARVGDYAEDIRQLVATRDALAAELARVEATRDRYQRNGKRVLAERRELESVLLAPGVRNALRKALHSDAHPGASASERRARDEAFAKLTEIYKRLER